MQLLSADAAPLCITLTRTGCVLLRSTNLQFVLSHNGIRNVVLAGFLVSGAGCWRVACNWRLAVPLLGRGTCSTQQACVTVLSWPTCMALPALHNLPLPDQLLCGEHNARRV